MLARLLANSAALAAAGISHRDLALARLDTFRSSSLREIEALSLPTHGAASFLRPGHVFPLRARAGGVLTRRGHAEAAVDLARLAGFEPAGALCELVDGSGEMLRGRQLEAFAQRHRTPLLHIADLVEYRLALRETKPPQLASQRVVARALGASSP